VTALGGTAGSDLIDFGTGNKLKRTADIKKSDDGERADLNRLDSELDSMIDELAGSDSDYDPTIEAAALEAIERADDADDE
jgi:hypothetical protein